MARQGRGKKSEKVGTGKVTAVQVAFIVDRYLAENHYDNTLAHFRSEAASLLGTTTHPRQAPKSMLSLADILDDYITLKEHKIALGQQKTRIDQLLFSIQDIIYAYHSGGILPGTTAPDTSNHIPCASSSPMVASPSEVRPSISGPCPIPSASASPAITARVATSALPALNTKRKNSNLFPDPSLNAKRTCLSTSPVQSFPDEGNAQGLQTAANGVYGPSQVGQSSSHNCSYPQVYSGNPLSSWGPSHSVSIPKGSYNQPSPAQGKQQPLHITSQMASDSSCPQTPPQALCIQVDTSAGSPPEASNIIDGKTVLAGSVSNIASSMRDQQIDQEIQIVEIRSSENFNSSKTFATPKVLSKGGNSSKASLSKLSPKKPGKRTQIKSRLDFNSSVVTSTASPLKPSTTRTPIECLATCDVSLTSAEMVGEQFDLADIPIIDPELDKFMSDFFIDFGLDSEELGSAAAFVDQIDEMSQSLEESRSSEDAIHTPVHSVTHLSKGFGVLTEKNMNIIATANARSIPDSSTTKNGSNCKGRIRGVADQENAPVLRPPKRIHSLHWFLEI